MKTYTIFLFLLVITSIIFVQLLPSSRTYNSLKRTVDITNKIWDIRKTYSKTRFLQSNQWKSLWGDWSREAMCPKGGFIEGLQVRYEDRMSGDITALNGLKIKCDTSSQLDWGPSWLLGNVEITNNLQDSEEINLWSKLVAFNLILERETIPVWMA